MSDIINDIIQILENGKAQIQSNLQAQNVNASGRTSRAFAVRNKDGHLQLYRGEGEKATINTPRGIFSLGVAPVDTLERGREGGNVPKGFYYIIRNWTREKGLSFTSERKRGTFSYFLARKIAREGTQRNKKNIDIYTSVARSLAVSIREKLNNNVKIRIKQPKKK